MSKTPLVSIVIPNYNSSVLLDKVLKSLKKTKYKNIELIVSDDASTDISIIDYKKICKKYHALWISHEQNSGPSFARNAGIMIAKGKYVAFIETDMEVDADWLNKPVEILENNQTIGAVATRVLDINHKDIIQCCGLKYDPHTFWVSGLHFAEKANQKLNAEYCSVGAVGSIFRTSDLRTVGMFDTKIVHNLDDIDLGWRMWVFGKKIITSPESITYHCTAKPLSERQKTTPSLSSELHFHKTIRVFIKNYELKNCIKYSIYYLIIYLLRDTVNAAKGNWTPIKAYILSLLFIVKSLPNSLHERKRIQNNRKMNDSAIMKNIFLKGCFIQIYNSYLNPVVMPKLALFRI